jgi:hypothetical protein
MSLRIELGINLGMSEILFEFLDIDRRDQDPLYHVHLDELDRYVKVRSSQIHPDSDVHKVGDVGHLVVLRRFAEIKRLI